MWEEKTEWRRTKSLSRKEKEGIMLRGGINEGKKRVEG